jgi:hypothetical protein
VSRESEETYVNHGGRSPFAYDEPEEEQAEPVAQPELFTFDPMPEPEAAVEASDESTSEKPRKGRGSRKTAARKTKKAVTESLEAVSAGEVPDEAPVQVVEEAPAAPKAARKSTARSRRPRKAATTS